jgi:hypothetical protein
MTPQEFHARAKEYAPGYSIHTGCQISEGFEDYSERWKIHVAGLQSFEGTQARCLAAMRKYMRRHIANKNAEAKRMLRREMQVIVGAPTLDARNEGHVQDWLDRRYAAAGGA